MTTVVAPPAAPTGLTATLATATQINLKWVDNSNNETSFEVWRKSGDGEYRQIATLPPDTTRFTDGSLFFGTSYTYRVKVVNDDGVAWSNEITVAIGQKSP